jgi:Gram-negative bacterial TonB protein C-terminal
VALSAKKIALVVLFSCVGAQATRCGVNSLHHAVITATEVQMGQFVLFRGEVVKLPEAKKFETGGCCEGRECTSVQCSMPVLPPPAMFLDYSVSQSLWGESTKPVIDAFYESSVPCGNFKPVLHEKIITICTFGVGSDDASAWCEPPIPDTEAALREVRGWIPEAIQHQKREKISEQEARAHVVHKVKPVLPKLYLAPGTPLHGDIVVRIFIGTSGQVQSIRALNGQQPLTQAAINAVSLWRFRPFRTAGRLVKIDTKITVHF